jgi:anti-anti-sigma factor
MGHEVVLDRRTGRLSGEIDMASAPFAERRLLASVLGTPESTVVIDCMELTFIDLSGVEMLEHVAQRSGKTVHLANLSPPARRVFEILKLCERFGIDGSAA